MITLYYQNGIIGGKWFPNSVPYHLRNRPAYKQNLFKGVKPKFITEMCDYLNLPYKQVSAEDYQGELAYYHIEIDWIDQAFVYQNVFEYIDEQPLNLLKDINSNLRLLLWFPNEGFSLDMPRFMDLIDFCCKDLGIPSKKVYLVFGDRNIKDNFEKQKSKHGWRRINVYGMSSFETTYNFEIDIMSNLGHNLITEKEFNNNWNKPKAKTFIFKNANPRPQRLYFAAELHHRDLLRHSYFSWLNRYFVPNPHQNDQAIENYVDFPKRKKKLHKSLINFLKGAPYIIDYDANEINLELNQRILINEQYNNSYFSFVTETTYEDASFEDVLFITEKLYQPIVNYHPFIVASQINTLEYLKDCGYATFPELFDESYDKEINIRKRTQIILNNIENWCKNPNLDVYFSNTVKDKLIHNRNLFFERKGTDEWSKVFEWLS